MADTQTLSCAVHGESTRLTCVDCGQPICPKCMTRTEVGLKCYPCAAPARAQPGAAPQGRRPVVFIAVGVGAVAVLAAVLLLRPSSSEPARPALPTPVGTWADAPDPGGIRGTATAVVLEDGTVLVSGGGVGAVAAAATAAYDPAQGAWRELPPMGAARRGHQAVLLNDGRVLVAGGLADGVPLASAEVYDPATAAWSAVAPMAVPRLGHSLTVLNDGKVLVAGGSAATEPEGTLTELFDPATGTWRPTGPLSTPRFEHTATRLRDGRVVMTGGLGPAVNGLSAPLASTEIYDPAANIFVGATEMATGRSNHAAVLLGDNAVVVSGGLGGEAGDQSLASSEVFDVRAGTWTTTAPLGGARSGHSAVGLNDGRVLVSGGELVQRGSRRSLTSAEVFDFEAGPTGQWGPAGDMACARSEQAAVRLADGTVLVVAGDAAFPGQAPIAQSCAERYTP